MPLAPVAELRPHRVPEGAEAVLINQSHTDPDLVLPIGRREKELFEAIDGRRTVGDIVDRPGAAGDEESDRGFFMRLWWHDQVVFDASTDS